MALESIVNGAVFAQEADGVARTYDPEKSTASLQQALTYLGETDVSRYAPMANNPRMLANVAKEITRDVQQKVVDETKSQIDDVLKELGEEKLQSYALRFSDKAAEIGAYRSALESGNLKALSHLIMDKDDEGNPDPRSLFNRYFIKHAGEREIMDVAAREVQRIRSEFVQENLITGDGEDRKFDMDTAVGYVKTQLENNANNELYLELANQLAQQAIESQRQRAA